ncbi:MAG: hypothetical protein LIP01_09555 [Tannerellaceae bacterium]|nr:hypothetical protein [Tannerellaceae bacterium]
MKGWLLLALFVLPFVVKSIHVEKHCKVCHCHEKTEKNDDHDAENCPVCHFTVSLFTEPELIYIPLVSSVICLPYDSFTEEPLVPFIIHHYLRGPPCTT